MNTTSFTRILTAVGVLIALSAQAQAASSHIVKRGSAPIAKVKTTVKTTGKTGGGTAQAQVDDSDLTCNSNVGIMECAEALKSMCDLGNGGMSSQPGGADECAPPPE